MELNREQIIRALECCITPRDCECDDCSLDKYGSLNCKWLLMSHSLSLIKELTEENERLRKRNITLEQKLMLLGIDEVYVFKAQVKGE